MNRPNLLPIIRKEFIHILRDPRSLSIVLIMPLIQLLLYSYAINMDVRDIKLAVLDESRTPASRELVRRFTGSGYFVQRASLDNRDQIEELFRRGTVKAVLAIPRNYAESVKTRVSTPVQILVDGSDSNTGAVILNTAQQLLTTASLDLSAVGFTPFQIRANIWYNPEQKSTYFIVPGLTAVIMMMICALLTSITIAREKETGTLEEILVAPVRPYELIIGKVLPYVALASADALIILLVGRIWFGIPFRGSPLVLTVFSLIYLLTSLSLGVLISTVARSQQVAMMMANLITMLPSVLLSGFIFPISSMPKWLQIVTYIIPARYFLEIIRGVLLKGNGFDVLWPQAAFLLGLAVLLLTVSVKRFKVRLE
jgi:ABC-2 type transport system permease protein